MLFEDGDYERLKIQLCISQQDPSCCRSLNTLQNSLSPCLYLLCFWIFLSLASRDRDDGTAWGSVQPRLGKVAQAPVTQTMARSRAAARFPGRGSAWACGAEPCVEEFSPSWRSCSGRAGGLQQLIWDASTRGGLIVFDKFMRS